MESPNNLWLMTMEKVGLLSHRILVGQEGRKMAMAGAHQQSECLDCMKSTFDKMVCKDEVNGAGLDRRVSDHVYNRALGVGPQ